jgi:cyclase
VIKLAILVAIAGIACAQQNNAELEMLHVQGNVYLLAGAGGNIAVQVGPTGVLLVDSGLAANTVKVLAAVHKLTDKQIRYLVNTHVHPDHTGGNETIAKSSGSSGIRSIRGTPGESLTQEVKILAHDNVLQRMVAPGPGEKEIDYIAQPTETWVGTQKDLFFNGESIAMMHQPAAHTDGDSIIYFRKSDVIVAGDLFVTTAYPRIDLTKGGNIQGLIDGLNHILDLAIPAHHEEGGTFIISGHGRVADQFDITEYRDMVTIIRDRIQAMIKRGATLEQVKTARLTRDYDPRYGSPDVFVESIYKSLTSKK